MEISNNILGFIHLKQTTDWNIKYIVGNGVFSSKYTQESIGDCLLRKKDPVLVQDDKLYKRLTIKTKGEGIIIRDNVIGKSIKTKKQFRVSSGQLAMSKIDARNGAFGLVPQEADGAIITSNFWSYEVNLDKVLPQFLVLILSSERFTNVWQECSNGSGNRLYLQEDKFLQYRIPLPSISEQENILLKYMDTVNKSLQMSSDELNKQKSVSSYLFLELGIKEIQTDNNYDMIKTASFSHLYQWGYDKCFYSFPYSFERYKAFSFSNKPTWMISLSRGKSPKYSADSASIILNQKCNRTDSIDLSYAKTVDTEWLEKFDKAYLTREGDILINSTGEGTLGRASLVTKEYEGLAYDSHMLLLRVNQEEVDPQLIVDLINSPFGQKQVELNKSAQATKQTELGVDNTKKLLFPLPDLFEQKRIAATVKEKKNRISALHKGAEILRLQAKKDFETAVFG